MVRVKHVTTHGAGEARDDVTCGVKVPSKKGLNVNLHHVCMYVCMCACIHAFSAHVTFRIRHSSIKNSKIQTKKSASKDL
jgi:hypothetical protein